MAEVLRTGVIEAHIGPAVEKIRGREIDNRDRASGALINMVSATAINSNYGSISREGVGAWWVEAWDETGEGGIRFNWFSSQLLPGRYRFTADITWVDTYGHDPGQAYADFADIEPIFGPVTVPGALSFEMDMPSWPMAFVDVYCDTNYDSINIVEFRIQNVRLERL